MLVDQDLDALETAVKQLTTFDKIILAMLLKKDLQKSSVNSAILNFGGIDILISNAVQQVE